MTAHEFYKAIRARTSTYFSMQTDVTFFDDDHAVTVKHQVIIVETNREAELINGGSWQDVFDQLVAKDTQITSDEATQELNSLEVLGESAKEAARIEE